jgi:[ribosomal protein S5]-alanine N-acetyltransferase
MVLDLPTQITTNRLSLQRVKLDDADEIFNAYASLPEVTRYMAWPTHKTIEDTRSFLNYATLAWDEGRDYSWSIRLKDRNELIGSFGIMNLDGKIQFGYSLGPSFWNRGYATEVVTEMMSRLKTEPGIYRINTFIDAENVASGRVLEKSGLVKEASLVKWFRFVNQGNEPKDCVLYRLELP